MRTIKKSPRAERTAATMASTGVLMVGIGSAWAVTESQWWTLLVIVGGVLVNFGVRLAIDVATGDHWWAS
jgi:hypothetical protein